MGRSSKSASNPKPKTTSGAVAPAVSTKSMTKAGESVKKTLSHSPRRTSGMKSGTRKTAAASARVYSPYVELTAHRRREKK